MKVKIDERVLVVLILMSVCSCVTNMKKDAPPDWPMMNALEIPYPVRFMHDAEIRIDGDPSDWPTVIPAHIDSDAQVVKGVRGKMGWMKGVIRPAFDSKNFYLFAEIDDATPFRNNNKEFYIWEGDSLEVYLGFHDRPHDFVEKDDFQFGFSLVPENPVLWNWSSNKALEKVTFAIIKTGKGCVFEACVPLSNFGVDSLAPGTSVWIDFCLNNSLSGNKREGQLVWYGDDRNYQKPALWKKSLVTDSESVLERPIVLAPTKLPKMIQYRLYVYSKLEPWKGDAFVNGKLQSTDNQGAVDVYHDGDGACEIIVPVDGSLITFNVEQKETTVVHNNKKPLRGAELRTHDAFLFGRYRIRMKAAAGSGIVSSFFTYHDPQAFTIDKWNEVDLEFLGKDPMLLQFNTITPKQRNHEHVYSLVYRAPDEFHTYGFEWTPESVRWFVDDVEVYRQDQAHIRELEFPQKMMMNIWQPNYPSWVGNFDANAVPAYAYYDWVEYHEYTPGKNGGFTLKWRDDFDAFDTSRWGRGTHTWEGNNSIFVAENVVFKDGFMILCLTTPENTGYDKK